MKTAIITALAGFAAAGALALAAPANAYHGGCFTDQFGRCMYAPPEMMTEEYSPADMAAWGVTPDQHFAYFVTHDNHDPFEVITNFDAVKAKGVLACQIDLHNGWGYQALETLGLSTDQAINVDSSAYAAYCPWAPLAPTGDAAAPNAL